MLRITREEIHPIQKRAIQTQAGGGDGGERGGDGGGGGGSI